MCAQCSVISIELLMDCSVAIVNSVPVLFQSNAVIVI